MLFCGQTVELARYVRGQPRQQVGLHFRLVAMGIRVAVVPRADQTAVQRKRRDGDGPDEIFPAGRKQPVKGLQILIGQNGAQALGQEPFQQILRHDGKTVFEHFG